MLQIKQEEQLLRQDFVVALLAMAAAIPVGYGLRVELIGNQAAAGVAKTRLLGWAAVFWVLTRPINLVVNVGARWVILKEMLDEAQHSHLHRAKVVSLLACWGIVMSSLWPRN